MKESHVNKKKMEKYDAKKLLDEVDKFRDANKKFLLPNLNIDKSLKDYRVIQSNHTREEGV